jgi:hypothetical protein
MFEVVQDEQQSSLIKYGEHSFLKRIIATLVHAQRLGDGQEHEVGIADRGKWHEHDAVIKLVCYGGRHLHGEASLADAARAGEGDQFDIVAQQQGANALHLSFTADERFWQ